jgi:hypothetical protein
MGAIEIRTVGKFLLRQMAFCRNRLRLTASTSRIPMNRRGRHRE